MCSRAHKKEERVTVFSTGACIKRGEKEHVTVQPGCGLGESVALCLNILFT